MVSVTPSQIGWDGIDLTTVQVKHDGAVQPVWIDGDTLRFYAPISPTRYMSETVFWLGRGDRPGAGIPAQPIASRAEPGVIDHYTATLHVEENHVYSPQVDEGDHWFWSQLSAPFTTTVPFTLTALADAPAQLTVAVWGNTQSPAAIDHLYRVLVNDQLLGEFAWDGQGPHTIEADVPHGVLREGAEHCDLFPARCQRRDGRHHVLELVRTALSARIRRTGR